jgi:hypothetical protein
MNSQPSNPESPPAADDRLDELSEEWTKRELKKCVQTLLKAKPNAIPALVARVQRLRLAMRLLGEISTGQLNEDTYRELVLLQRMLKDGGPVDPGDTDEAAEARAVEDLTRLNINLDEASRIASLFDRVATPDMDDKSDIPDDFEPDDTDTEPE